MFGTSTTIFNKLRNLPITTVLGGGTVWAPVLYVMVTAVMLVCGEASTSFLTLKSALLLSATVTFTLATLLLPQRLVHCRAKILTIFNIFLLLTYWYTTTNNLLTFFFIYELFLLPSSYLVYKISPNKRAIKSTTYFVWWTQAGSMLVFGGIILHILGNGTIYFTEINHLGVLPGLLVLLGFGVKIPIFPFFFWLTKTHVEAITSFSIFLSGFLVKLALFGLVKFQILNNSLTAAVLTPLTLVSITAASVGFIYQTDYKKIIAYATVQEMNILTLIYLLTAHSNTNVVSSLLVVHTLLSSLFFSLADMLYKKYNSRSLATLKGLGNLAPKMSTLLVVAVLVFKGLPYTAKFPVEFSLYASLLQENALLGIFVTTTVVFAGNLFFTILNMSVIFGSTKTDGVVDLSLREFGTLLTPTILLIWLVI